MRISQRPLSRFIGALILAPMAGAAAAAAAGVIVVAFAGDWSWDDALRASLTLAFFALIISFLYTLVVGTLAFIYTRKRERTPAAGTAIVVGLIVGVIPFAIPDWDPAGNLLAKAAFPALAGVCSIATAWTFWRLALAREPVLP